MSGRRATGVRMVMGILSWAHRCQRGGMRGPRIQSSAGEAEGLRRTPRKPSTSVRRLR